MPFFAAGKLMRNGLKGTSPFAVRHVVESRHEVLGNRVDEILVANAVREGVGGE